MGTDGPGAGPTTLLIADDRRILMDGLRRLLEGEPDMQVVAAATDVDAAIASVVQLRPDVAVLNGSMARGAALEIARRISGLGLPTRTIVLAPQEARSVIEAVHAGASGYVPDGCPTSELFAAVRAVAAGGTYLTAESARLLLDADGRRPVPLSPREREVMRLTALGHSNAVIGRTLSVSTKTVDTYRARAMAKLGLHGRSELMKYALGNGLLP